MPNQPKLELDPRSLLDRLAEEALRDPKLANALLSEEGLDPSDVAREGMALLNRLTTQTGDTSESQYLHASSFEERIEELALRLGWQSGPARTQPARGLHTADAVAFTGLYYDQPVALFVGGGEGVDINALVNEAAERAYQASIPWGIAKTPEATIVFNSLWYSDEGWYRVRSDALPEGAFTPEGVTRRDVEHEALRIKEFEGEVLVPIDEQLVDQLDMWRREALSLAESQEERTAWDGAIHGLFAKLFIVRTVEDMGIGEGLPSVRDAVQSAPSVIDALKGYFLHAKRVIESDLFDDERYTVLPPEVVERIVHELYKPKDFRVPGFRYDFSWVRSDVLGQAYEQYLSRVLAPADGTVRYPDLFGNVRSHLSETSVRKNRGVYYTPSFLVRHLCRQAFAVRGEEGLSSAPPRVADFSCGSGSFLRSAVDILLQRLNDESPKTNWGQEIVKQKLVVGVDTDERAVEFARLNVYQRLIQEESPLPLPRLRECIVKGDALSTATWGSLPNEYDVVVGNPPFLSTLRQAHSRSELRQRFRTARGRFDTAHLFVELALEKLKKGGALAMVVPNRIFGNRDAAPLRDVVTQDARLVAVEDFGALEVFDQTSAYIGTIIAKRSGGGPQEMPFRFVRVIDLPGGGASTDEFLGVELDRAVNADDEYESPHVIAYMVQSQMAAGAPWRFYSPAVRLARQNFEVVSLPFDEVCDVRQGIRTGANDTFITRGVVSSSRSARIVEVVNGLGDRFPIEAPLLRPLTYGAEIERYGRFDSVGKHTPSHVILYPYVNGNPITEPVLRDEYPYAYEYLRRQKAVLTSRRCVEVGSTEWYQLERARPGSWLVAPKLFMRDLAQRPSFAANEEGGVYLVGGTAVIPNDSGILLPLLGFLNSALAAWYLSSITPEFRSGYRKVEPQHLRKLRVPSFISRENVSVDDAAAREELSDLVSDRLLLGPSLEPEDEGHQEAIRLEEAIDGLIYDQTGVRPVDY